MNPETELLEFLRGIKQAVGNFEFKVVLNESGLTLATPGFIEEQDVLKIERRLKQQQRTKSKK